MAANAPPQNQRRPRNRRLDVGFQAATSLNLPQVETIMIVHYIMNNADYYAAEYRHKKVLDLGQSTYTDDAVGWVQVSEINDICTVKAKITAQHRSTIRYDVTVAINVIESEITSARCEGPECIAAAGGCKHAIAVLFWLHKKTNQPASTTIPCYWRSAAYSHANLGQCKFNFFLLLGSILYSIDNFLKIYS